MAMSHTPGYGNHVIIDRPKCPHHTHYPDIVYSLDYGYLDGNTSSNDSGIDAWAGASGTRDLSAVILTVDLNKRDAEIKILLGCTEDEIQTILAFHNENDMRATLIRKPKEQK
jgi:inorganic pyrophosphatase